MVTWNGRVFEEDNIKPGLIAGIAVGKSKMLAQNGFTKIKHLKRLTNDVDIKQAANAMTGIGFKSLKGWVEAANRSLPGSAPPVKDHTKEPNPYMSLYPDTYEKELRNTIALQNSCTINDLIDHIFTESEKIFKGTAYEDNWYVYHDALSLLTSKRSIT